MLNDFDHFFIAQAEPQKSCLQALRTIILQGDEQVAAAWKYRMPFFCYKGKMFCYLWIDKQNSWPYIGWVEGKHLNFPELEQEKRKRMKILRINPEEDLPIDLIETILQQALDLYRKGIIPLK